MQNDIKHLLVLCNLEKIDDFSFVMAMSGGNASTSLCYQNPDGEKIVVKILVAPRGEWELREFQHEADALSRFSSHDYGFWPRLRFPVRKVDGLPFYYFGYQYLEGTTLKAFIEQNPLPWDWKKVMLLMRRLCCALGESMIGHVHRDLHFGNILLTDPDKIFQPLENFEHRYGVAVLDAGCVFFIVEDMYQGVVEDKFRLRGGVSTWSPEVLNGTSSIRYPHDSWALGIMLHALLTGRRPIEVESIAELYRLFQSDGVALPFLEGEAAIPDGVKLLNKNLLSIDPQKRCLYGEIATFCQDALHSDLLEAPEWVLEAYFKFKGGIVECRCGAITIGPRCGKCHAVIDWENASSVSSYKDVKKIFRQGGYITQLSRQGS